MRRYKIEYTETQHGVATVEANSFEEAEDLVRDGDISVDYFVNQSEITT